MHHVERSEVRVRGETPSSSTFYCGSYPDKNATDGSPSDHANAPVGLSLIARRLEEEKVVAMLELIKNVVGVDYEDPASEPGLNQQNL